MNQNQSAWNEAAYAAWITRFGTPEAYAEKLRANPEKIVKEVMAYLPSVAGKRLLNLMGSNGNKAVCFALLGAAVTVVDFSEANRRYALALAEAADVRLEYLCEDVLTFRSATPYDTVVAEMGILHYFTDLVPFFKVMTEALVPGGIALVRDFHPVSTKLIVSRGSTAKVRKHKVAGDYFSEALVAQTVAFDKYLDEGAHETVYLRKWTLGEIVTQAVEAGLVIKGLYEHPNQSSETFDAGIPKTFTLLLSKPL